ncbi:MAG: PAS domain S-box protein, partial [Chloroflexota bacterium]
MATILIVDDRPTNRDVLVTLLKHKGHRLLEAADGAEALERAQAERPDLIITDILMPTMDGYELVRRLRAEPALVQTPIIFYTAHYLEREAQALAQACGVKHILIKPSKAPVVLQTVEAALSRPAPPAPPAPPEAFEREHIRLLTNKLSQTVAELQAVNTELQHHAGELEQEVAERRQTEEALREKTAELRFVNDLIEQTTQPIVVVGLEGWLLRFNRAFEHLTGYSRDELLSMTYQQLTPERWHELEAQQVAQLLATGQARRYEKEYRRKDGLIVPLELVVDLYRNEAGEVEYLYAFVTDITERKQAEAEIRRHNRELTLLNQVIAACATYEEPEVILEVACRELALAFYVPQATASLLNEEKTAVTVIAEYRAEGRPTALGATLPTPQSRSLQRLLRYEGPLLIEQAPSDPRLAPFHELLRRNGIASLLILPLRIKGEVVGTLSLESLEPRQFSPEEINLAWSVADQVAGALARARLTQLHQRLSTAIEQAGESVVVTDTEGAILYVNPTFERTTGYSQAEAMGRRMSLIKSGQQDPAFYRELWATIRAGQVWHGRFINKKKDGSLYTEEATITPVLNESGLIVNFVSVQRDVTHELQLEEQ